MKKKNLLIIMIIAVLVCILLLLKRCQKTEEKISFDLQGETTISAGFIRMKVWDNETEDGDTVNVYFDGKLMKENAAILNMPFVIELGNLGKGEHILGVKAVSEGMSEPATASLSLYNDSEEKEFEMNATIRKPASWKINIK